MGKKKDFVKEVEERKALNMNEDFVKEIQERVNHFEPDEIITEEMLSNAINDLDNKQKEILDLYLKGLSSKDIGIYLNEKTLRITNQIKTIKSDIVSYMFNKHGVNKLISNFTFNLHDINPELILAKIDKLTPENEMIKWLYGMKDGKDHTYQEVGEIFNITRERARKLVVMGMRKMRKEILDELHS